MFRFVLCNIVNMIQFNFASLSATVTVQGREVPFPLFPSARLVTHPLTFLQCLKILKQRHRHSTPPLFSPREAPRLLRNVTLVHLPHVIDHFIFPSKTGTPSAMTARDLAIDHLNRLPTVRVGDVAFHVCFARADVAAVGEETGHFRADDERLDKVMERWISLKNAGLR